MRRWNSVFIVVSSVGCVGVSGWADPFENPRVGLEEFPAVVFRSMVMAA
jgi:hypothetical protein